jgi:hypothetical protein
VSRVVAAARSWIVGCGLALAAVVALGWFPTRRLVGPDGLQAMAAGCVVALVGAALGAAPVLWALAQGEAGKGPAAAGRAMALRAAGTLLLALAVALGTDVPRTPFVIWVGLGYLALLVAETRWTVRWLTVLGN